MVMETGTYNDCMVKIRYKRNIDLMLKFKSRRKSDECPICEKKLTYHQINYSYQRLFDNDCPNIVQEIF